jgi:hypothetical protein
MSGTKSDIKHGLVNPLEREVRSVGKKAAKALATETHLSWVEVLRQTFGMEISDNNNADPSEKPAHAPAHEKTADAHNHIEIFNFLTHQKSASENSHASSEKKTQRSEAAMDYHGQFRNEIVRNREKVSRSEHQEMQQNIQQIKVELSKLVASSQILKLEFAEVSVEQTAPNIGQYHLNFFEWMLTVIRAAREKVEDSNAWLGTVKGKGAKRDYWSMFKTHGTTFGLSGERSVATQVG